MKGGVQSADTSENDNDMIEVRPEERGGVRTADFALRNQYGVYDEFMVLALRDGALMGLSGVVKYLPEFREAEC